MFVEIFLLEQKCSMYNMRSNILLKFLMKDRPKYIHMKPKQIVKLSPEDRQDYENSLKIEKTPKCYGLISRPY